MNSTRRWLVSAAALLLLGGSAVANQNDKHDGSWVRLGTVTAGHGADDSGAPETLEVRENISKDSETRAIDLKGGKRSIRTIEFWYDTQGILNGKAEVTAYGQR